MDQLETAIEKEKKPRAPTIDLTGETHSLLKRFCELYGLKIAPTGDKIIKDFLLNFSSDSELLRIFAVNLRKINAEEEESHE